MSRAGDTKNGTIGFSPQLAGHAKADRSHTTSFGAGMPGKVSVRTGNEYAGQEEGGRERLPSTSAVGRILPQQED